jgi:hypothetical protein
MSVVPSGFSAMFPNIVSGSGTISTDLISNLVIVHNIPVAGTTLTMAYMHIGQLLVQMSFQSTGVTNWNTGTYFIPFPTTFPTMCAGVVTTGNNDTAGGGVVTDVTGINTTGFTLQISNNKGSVCYFAWGY